MEVYFDNVGGTILDLMLTRMAMHGRCVSPELCLQFLAVEPFTLKACGGTLSLHTDLNRIAACGSISGYNSTSPTVLENYMDIITMRIQIRGFIVLDYLKSVPEVMKIFQEAVKEGKLKIDEGEQVVPRAFEDIPKTWMKLFEGSNTGKLVTKLV